MTLDPANLTISTDHHRAKVSIHCASKAASQGLSAVGKFLWTFSDSNVSLEKSDNGQFTRRFPRADPQSTKARRQNPQRNKMETPKNQVGMSRFEALELRH